MAKILIIGGSGFLGSNLAVKLTAAGHQVDCPKRNRLDLIETSEQALCDQLSGAEIVINCAGLVSGPSMNAVHAEGTAKLLKAARATNIRRLLHISALGATTSGDTVYQRSKGTGEDIFRSHQSDCLPECCILRPSLIIGRGGASTAMLSALAALPVTPVIAAKRVQPIHIQDFTELILQLLEQRTPLPRFMDVVGPEPMDINSVVKTIGRWLQLPSRISVPVPGPLMAGAAAIVGLFSAGPLNTETLTMLRQGNTASPAALAKALNRPPLPLNQALALTPASHADRQMARLYFVRPVLRISLAFMWIATGIVSLGLYPLAKSYALMASLGLTGALADIALFGAATLDIILGVLLLIKWRPRLVGTVQLATISVFTLLALGLPAEYWLHPFAPLIKNLPIAAATLAMMAMED